MSFIFKKRNMYDQLDVGFVLSLLYPIPFSFTDNTLNEVEERKIESGQLF